MSEITVPKKQDIVGATGETLVDMNQTAEAPVPFQDFDEYQMLADKTNITKGANRVQEALMGIPEEVGEFMSVHNRMARGDYETEDELQTALLSAVDEMGDIMWYMASWCTAMQIPFGEVAFRNLEKLKKRFEKDLIKGSGSDIEKEVQNDKL